MFASEKPVWYRIFMVLASGTFLYTLVSLGYDRHAFGIHKNENQAGYLSSKTLAALNGDAQFQSTLVSLTEQLAQASSELGARFGVESVRTFGAELASDVVELRKREALKLEKRGFFADAASAFQSLAADNDAAGGGGIMATLEGAIAKKFNLTGGIQGIVQGIVPGLNLTGGLTGVIDSVGSKLTSSLADPALFLGIGVG
jgi:hypothetical protein